MVRHAHIQAERWMCIIYTKQGVTAIASESRRLSMGNGSMVPGQAPRHVEGTGRARG